MRALDLAFMIKYKYFIKTVGNGGDWSLRKKIFFLSSGKLFIDYDGFYW